MRISRAFSALPLSFRRIGSLLFPSKKNISRNSCSQLTQPYSGLRTDSTCSSWSHSHNYLAMSKSNLPNVVFVLGAPGAGKGTQCEKILQEFGYIHLSAGDLLRNERQYGGEVAEEIEKHIKNGTIVPVAITVGLLEKAMNKHMKEENNMNFLIDGFPRNKDNLDGWNEVMSEKANVKFVLFFEVSTQTGIDRAIKRGQAGSGRSDDNLEILTKRINTYIETTMPIVEHYDKLNLLRKVDGSPSADEVFSEVRKLFL